MSLQISQSLSGTDRIHIQDAWLEIHIPRASSCYLLQGLHILEGYESMFDLAVGNISGLTQKC